MTNERRTYQEALKRHIVAEVEEGRMSPVDASREYGVPKCLVRLWVEEFGRFRPKRDIVEVVMKSEKERIAELEKALAQAHLKIRAYDELINIAGKKLRVDIKKNFGSMSSEHFEGSDTKPPRRVKRSK